MLSILYYLFLAVICVLFLLLSVVALVLTYPFQKSRLVVHELTRVMVRIFLFIPPLWRYRVIGLEHVDPNKSYVVVINHRAMIDIPVLYLLSLNFRWVSKREVFKIPFFGQFLRVHGDICIDRGHAAAAMEQLLRDGTLWLRRGVSVAIFPEGTRSRDGEIHRFKMGAFALAHEAGVDILPVVMDGTTALIRPNKLFNWRNTVTVKVLPPISAAQVAQSEVKELAEQVHGAMCKTFAEIRSVR